MAFDGLGGNVETGQDVELFTALLERSFAAHQRHHAAHAGRAGGACDVEFAVTRALSPAACRAEVVGALETHLAHHGGELFGASIAVASLLTAGAGDSGRHGLGGRQQLAQQRGPGAMHGAANRRLDGFEIEGVAAALAAEDDPEQLRHFLGDFVADGFGRFFFLGRRGVFGGSQTANAFVDIEQLPAELLEAMKLGHLAFGLAAIRGRREGLSYGLAAHFFGEAEMRTMGRLVGLVAAAIRFAAAAAGGGNRAAAKVS